MPDFRKSGLTPFVLNLQRALLPKLSALGEGCKIVSARGPFTIASHLMPLTELLVGMKTEPETMRGLFRATTDACKQWLSIQLEIAKDARAILVLDDVCGFLNAEDFQALAEPYLKEIFSAFGGLLHLFHNDTDNDSCYPFLDRMGVDAFNPTHGKDIAQIRRQLGGRVAIIGNIPPMALAQETPETVRALTRANLAAYAAENGDCRGLILSTGGGAPMGARGENIAAMLEAAKTFS